MNIGGIIVAASTTSGEPKPRGPGYIRHGELTGTIQPLDAKAERSRVPHVRSRQLIAGLAPLVVVAVFWTVISRSTGPAVAIQLLAFLGIALAVLLAFTKLGRRVARSATGLIARQMRPLEGAGKVAEAHNPHSIPEVHFQIEVRTRTGETEETVKELHSCIWRGFTTQYQFREGEHVKVVARKRWGRGHPLDVKWIGPASPDGGTHGTKRTRYPGETSRMYGFAAAVVLGFGLAIMIVIGIWDVVMRQDDSTTQTPAATASGAPPVAVAGGGEGVWPSAGSCATRRNAAGRLLPDPLCTPGTLADELTAAQLCAGDYVPAKPTELALERAVADTVRAYSSSGAEVKTSDIAFLVPIRLGGTYAHENMWPRGAFVASDTVAAVRAELCRTGSTLTLDDVMAAATANDLGGLVGPSTP